jgi:hypothetical protein
MYSLPNVRCGSLPHQLIRYGACCRSGWFTGYPEVIHMRAEDPEDVGEYYRSEKGILFHRRFPSLEVFAAT